VLVWVVFGTQIARFGLGNAQLAIMQDSRISEVSYWVFSASLIVVWMGALSWSDSRSTRVLGSGPTEYLRVVDSSLRVFGAIAILAFLTKIDVARGFLLISLPVGILVLLFTRWLWRQWLIAMRKRGTYSARVLLVGSIDSVAQIARELGRSPSSGYLVVGACTPSGTVADVVPGTEIPMMGSVNAIERAMELTDADTVAVTSTDELPPDKVKQISWNLQAGRQHLVLAPSIVDIAGPRLHTRPVAGLPLIHVETPRFSEGQNFLKRALDISVSLVAVVLLSPVLAFLAMTVRLTSEGPVLFRQVRIGRGGREFTMLKFRSMVTNAEELLENLWRERQEQGLDSGNEVMFKMKDDPRVTPIGESKRRNTRAYLLAYTLLLTGIAFWPVPVDQGAGPLLRLITRAIPVLTYDRIEFAANILLFVPLGLLLTLILVRNRWLVLPVAFLATVTIECVQALLLDARTPSVLDIVANTTGACIGILIAVFIDALRAVTVLDVWMRTPSSTRANLGNC